MVLLSSTPYGNTFTIEMAKAAIESEKLGADAITDILAVSFSSLIISVMDLVLIL